MRHKGARTDKQREADHPYAVDIPIGGNGLGQNLNRIIDAAKALPGGAEQWQGYRIWSFAVIPAKAGIHFRPPRGPMNGFPLSRE